MNSLAQRILQANSSFIFFHTHYPTQKVIRQAIACNKSIDLDISVDRFRQPYLGHSQEYYKKSKTIPPQTMPFSKAIQLVSHANVPVIVDCKHHNAWLSVKEAVGRIGAQRCLVNSFVDELKFSYKLKENDYLVEWSSIKKLTAIKDEFPAVTITASCKFLPNDLLLSPHHESLLRKICRILKANKIDTVSLNVPDYTISDKALTFFLDEKIIPHVKVDHIDTSKLSKLYIGETDILAQASDAKTLGYQPTPASKTVCC